MMPVSDFGNVFFLLLCAFECILIRTRLSAAQAVFLQLSVGGTLWFPNLTAPDPLYVMPVLIGATNLANIEVQHMLSTRCHIRNNTGIDVIVAEVET